MRLMCGSCRCCAGGPCCASRMSFPKPVASSSLDNSPRSVLRSISSLSRSILSRTPSLTSSVPCLLSTCLHPLFQLPTRMHHLAVFDGRHVAATSQSKRHLLQTGQFKKRGQKWVPGRAKKTPADPEHLSTTYSAPRTPTSMLMGKVQCTRCCQKNARNFQERPFPF